MYKLGIIGYTGMVGMELTRLIQEEINGGAPLEIVYTKNSKGESGTLSDCDLVFLATKDRESMENAEAVLAAGCKVIDMSGAFRLAQAEFEQWYGIAHTVPDLLPQAVYGLPAFYREKIKKARLVANPGCYATSVILALGPLRAFTEGEATVVSTSGNSGARREAEETADDIAYSFGRKHKHVPEMVRYTGVSVNFTPIVLRSVFRGINTNIRIKLREPWASLSPEEAREQLEEAIRKAYVPADEISVVRDGGGILYGTAAVNNTNRANIKINVDDGHAYINCCLDNLGKGAASQGIENMKLMLGI